MSRFISWLGIERDDASEKLDGGWRGRDEGEGLGGSRGEQEVLLAGSSLGRAQDEAVRVLPNPAQLDSNRGVPLAVEGELGCQAVLRHATDDLLDLEVFHPSANLDRFVPAPAKDFFGAPEFIVGARCCQEGENGYGDPHLENSRISMRQLTALEFGAISRN